MSFGASFSLAVKAMGAKRSNALGIDLSLKAIVHVCFHLSYANMSSGASCSLAVEAMGAKRSDVLGLCIAIFVTIEQVCNSRRQ